ncbi:MAG TPA: hypothetical protein VNN81_17445 [Bradyrhizobium sp.]|jgi:hypothetical protein|nr:hypothetical protein [Bradyrhizobium sp.]
MKTTISMIAVAAAIAFSAVSFTATQAAARPGPRPKASITPPEHYCLSYEAGSECGFTSDAQCEAMASGIGGNCKQVDDRPAQNMK